MDLDVPIIRVNTVDGYDPVLDDIAIFSRER